jgi:hypothetical protein
MPKFRPNPHLPPFPEHFPRATATLPPARNRPAPRLLNLKIASLESLQPVLTTLQFPGAGRGADRFHTRSKHPDTPRGNA